MRFVRALANQLVPFVKASAGVQLQVPILLQEKQQRASHKYKRSGEDCEVRVLPNYCVQTCQMIAHVCRIMVVHCFCQQVKKTRVSRNSLQELNTPHSAVAPKRHIRSAFSDCNIVKHLFACTPYLHACPTHMQIPVHYSVDKTPVLGVYT